jgi:NAD(P)-dependent dehydrogenase (short-subunit alcohol dehydrogenase family)
MTKIGNAVKVGVKQYLNSKKKVYVNTYTLDSSSILSNKNIVITGATSGIGLCIAQLFSRQGAKTILVGRNEKKLKECVKSINNSTYYVLDIKDVNKYDEFFEYLKNNFNKIDVFVNNAGISLHENNILSVDELGFDEQFLTNLKGPYFLTQKYIKMVKSDLNIIFISSERGSQCDDIPYGLTKIAINSLIEGLSYRFIKNNIRVNGIAPGVTASNIVKVDTKGNMGTAKYVSGRFFLPEEVAEVALFLASDSSKCISGEIIHTNDGNHLNSYLNLNK